MGTRIRTRITPKIRVMSFVMAFVILVVSLPIWIGNTGTKVKAADLIGDGNHIYSDTKTTTIKTNGTNSSDTRFQYTGKITKAQTELFDYVSDYELINNSYNNIIHTEGGYDDAYTAFNDAISQSNNAVTPLHAADKNITITLSTTSFDGDVYVYLWNGLENTSQKETPWPGKKMTYDSVSNCFTYTFTRDTASSSSPHYLDFNPQKVIFNNGASVQTITIDCSMTTLNKTYYFKEEKTDDITYVYISDDTGMYLCYWDENHSHTCGNGNNLGNEHKLHSMTHYTGSPQTNKFTWHPGDTDYVPKKFTINNGDKWELDQSLPYDSETKQGFTYFVYWTGGSAPVCDVRLANVGLESNTDPAQAIYDTKYTYPLYFGCFWRSNSAYADVNNSGYVSTNKPGSNLSYGPYNSFWWQVNMGLKNIGIAVGTGNDETDRTNKTGSYVTDTNTDGFRVRGTASTQGLVDDSLSNGNLVDVDGRTKLPYFDKTSSLVTNGLMKYYDKDETGDNIQFPFYEVRSDAATYVGSGTNKLAGTYQNYTGEGAKTQYAKFYQFDSKESNVRFEIENDDPSLHKGHFVETSQAITKGSSAGYFPFNNVNNNSENKHNLGFGTKFQMTFKLQEDGCVGVVDEQGNVLNPNKYKTRVHTIFEFEGDDDLWVFIDGNLVLDMGGDHLKSHGVIDFAAKTATVDKAITIGAHRTQGYSGNDKDDLGVDYQENAQVSGDTFRAALKSGSFKDATDETTNAGGTKYKDTETHTLTVFYMERGMLDSNLLVRFNYTPEANFSKMKIAEVTDFSAVNDGLQSLTMKAAEDDVFKYTVENKGTLKADVLTDTSAKYPTTDQRDRKNEIDSTISTRLFNQYNSTTPATVPYIPPGQLSGSTWTDATDKWSTVCGVSYLWVDENTVDSSNVSSPKMVGKTTGDTSNIGADGCSTDGALFLMYGTCNDLYPQEGVEKVGKESSAEFEKTFTRDSIMKVTQDTSLYAPNRNDSPATFGASTRSVADYYSTSVRLIDRVGHLNKTLENDGVNDFTDSGNPILKNGGQYEFNNASNVSTTSSVQLTEYFVNTVNVGAISVIKTVNSPSGVTNGEAANSDRFEFTVQFTDVFGVSGVTVAAADYTDITISGAKDSNGAAITKLLTGGKFYLEKGDTATISGIPVGTKYTITETTTTNYEASGNVSSAKTIANGTVSGTTYTPSSVTETITNTRLTGSLVLEKAEGTYWDANGITSITPFEFTVTLTKPSTISFDNFKAYFSDVSSYTENSSAGTLTRVFEVYKGTPQTIYGIPYGTAYSVEETGTGGSESHTGSNTSGTISGSTVTATITNNYPAVLDPISLDIEKVEQGNASTKLSGATFDLYYSPDAANTALYSGEYPDLYSTGNVTYSWTEDTTDPNYNYIRFVDTLDWGDATAHFFTQNGSTSSNSGDVTKESEIGTYVINGTSYPVYKFDIPNTSPNRVIFHKPNDWSNEYRTLTIELIGNGHGYVYYPTSVDDNGGTAHEYYPKQSDTTSGSRGRVVQVAEPAGASIDYSFTQHTSNKIYLAKNNNDSFHVRAFFFNSDGTYYKNGAIESTVETLTSETSTDWPKDGTTGNYTNSSSINEYYYSWEVPCINSQYFNRVVFWNNNNDDQWITTWITLDASNNYGKGQLFYRGARTGNGSDHYDPRGQLGNNPIIFSKDLSNSNPVIRTYSNGSSANVALIEGAANDEYLFDSVTFTGNAVTSGSTTTCTATYQPEDRYDTDNNFIYITGVTDPHVKFFTTTDGTGTAIGGTDAVTYGIQLTSAESGDYAGYYKIRLPRNAASFKVNDGTSYTLNDDAGSKFTVDSSGNVDTASTVKRTTTAKPALTTDSFISFRDVNNAWNGTVFAYYFGGTNGEYSEWQGVSPFKSYADGSDTIYVFQYPTGGTTAYPKVVFNSGAYLSNNRTSAITYSAGNIYQSGSTAGSSFTPDSSQTGSWIKLATVETGTGGTIGKITWLKDTTSDVNNIDTVYLANVSGDINSGAKQVKVKKTGTYIWKETAPPSTYELAPDTVFIVTDSDRGNASNPKKVTIADPKAPTPSTGEIILTKTAKEQVGTTAIGTELPGAQFKLVTVGSNTLYTFTRLQPTSTVDNTKTTNEYTYAAAGTFNASGSWLETGADGRLHIKGLPNGDYYLEEQAAPNSGFVNTDSNDNGNAKKVYFSVGSNTGTKEITCSDEMAPAYIKLYEHINEKLPAWGNPTFIFKITQTGYYKNDGTNSIQTISNGKTMIVALTVDDDGKFTTDTVLGSDYNGWYQESTDELEGESPNQTREYQGMYHIDNQGRIRLEPGTYTITRVPVSRYEFVADTFTDSNTSTFTANTTGAGCATGLESAVSVTVNQGDTAIVHYYDKVAYYDKFSHVDEEINKFYTLNASKNNTTAKGIRVEYNTKVSTATSPAAIITNEENANGGFNAWFINVDGTERAMTASEKANLVISNPNSQFTSGDFVFNDSSKQIQISNTSNYVNKVFTLKAVYKKDTTDLFETTFDLVFARS